MTILLWDIDGTLLTTNRAGITAWQDALVAVAGDQRSLDDLHTAGSTDIEIAHMLLHQTGADPGLVATLVSEYEDRLPAALGLRDGKVLPNVLEILSALDGHPTTRMLLLTGNSRRGARAKLSHYGLARFFEYGAYADDANDRPGVARVALERARQLVGPLDPERCIVIGDTPADIKCGQAIGARTIAVATGVYSLEELRREGPSILFAQLPAPGQFASAVGVSL